MKKFMMSLIMVLCMVVLSFAATYRTNFVVDTVTTNIDGTAITTAQKPLSYQAYCGNSSGLYNIVSATTTSTSIAIVSAITSTMSTGKYYCAITVADALGNESDFSNEVSICKSSGGYFRSCGTPSAPQNLQIK